MEQRLRSRAPRCFFWDLAVQFSTLLDYMRAPKARRYNIILIFFSDSSFLRPCARVFGVCFSRPSSFGIFVEVFFFCFPFFSPFLFFLFFFRWSSPPPFEKIPFPQLPLLRSKMLVIIKRPQTNVSRDPKGRRGARQPYLQKSQNLTSYPNPPLQSMHASTPVFNNPPLSSMHVSTPIFNQS